MDMNEQTRKGAAVATMQDHVERFWRYLETENLRILVEMRRDTSSVPYWDRSSFSDDVAKALVQERNAITTPVDGVRCASCDGTGVDLYDGTAHDCQVCSGRGTTPVDGVGAEPVAWQPIDTAPKGCVTEDAGCRGESEWFFGRVSSEFRKHGAAPFVVIRRRAWPQEDSWADNGETHYVPRYFDAWAPLSALANPEAEARLRERVAELTFDLKVARTYGDEQSIRAHRNLERAEAAEARLAQAEGGPAVTEAYAFEYNGEGYSATGERTTQPNAEQVTETMVERAAKAIVETDHTSEGLTFTELSRAMARAALEAALHPQSAAGEEGKP